MKAIQFSTLAFKIQHAVANPAEAIVALAKRSERGDADSSGSTIRTGLVVALVIALLAVLAAAVSGLGGRVAGRLDGVLP